MNDPTHAFNLDLACLTESISGSGESKFLPEQQFGVNGRTIAGCGLSQGAAGTRFTLAYVCVHCQAEASSKTAIVFSSPN
jgi:hypothetical protein